MRCAVVEKAGVGGGGGGFEVWVGGCDKVDRLCFSVWGYVCVCVCVCLCV